MTQAREERGRSGRKQEASTSSYSDFLSAKTPAASSDGLEIAELSPKLFGFQRDIVKWALRQGKAAILADCGLGKTPMQLEWARHVSEATNRPVLILAPLAVSRQTKREGEKFDIAVTVCRSQKDVVGGVNVTNYEMLEQFAPSEFAGVVLDESSILKAYDGKTRTAIIDAFRNTPYKLACTATAAPNDFMELGNHSEFLDVLTRAEMLAMFFIHDGGRTSQWRLKGHAENHFWQWVASWAAILRSPSNLGYEDDGFKLPPLHLFEHVVGSEAPVDRLFAVEAQSLEERRLARQSSLSRRVSKTAEIVASDTERAWLLWCDLNAESEALTAAIPGAVEIRGSHSSDYKERAMIDFSEGRVRVLVTKPSIAGFGMNWQHCARQVFVGLSDSYEKYYQAVRRSWRFGQAEAVKVHVVISDAEGAVMANIKAKEARATQLAAETIAHTQKAVQEHIRGQGRERSIYRKDVAKSDRWTMHLGDCVEICREIASVDYTIFSPPFASLYTYSDSERDMGNCSNDREFYEHFRFLVTELYRLTAPGRLVSFHCMNLPTTKSHFGYIGIRDFRGEMIRLFEQAGFIFHSEVCIWKDPVTAMQRTKALGLLYKQLKKDSAMSRQGIPDYLVTMRKPGDNVRRITKTPEDFPLPLWQQYASPVWADINPSDTLQSRSVREHADERHICPLQLEVIRRAVRLWSNPNDLVFSPFAGIGSEGVIALELGRQFVGIELKGSYYQQANANLMIAASIGQEVFDFEQVGE